ncbi:MAG: hypothetical protein V4474_04225 [Patescibacteria group bacterium]
MVSLKKNPTLNDFQSFNRSVYGRPDDRMYSVTDLLTLSQRFAMRALKGIRKGAKDKIEVNLLVSFSFLFALANRLHICLEDELWTRFPMQCSYCAHSPCVCKKTKPLKRPRLKIDETLRPYTIREFQTMFSIIYPAERRTLAEAGMHMAEEFGEVAEALHNFLGQHQNKQFEAVKHEIADSISCVFSIANSAKIDVSKGLASMFKNNCHMCKEAPCVCTFDVIAKVRI